MNDSSVQLHNRFFPTRIPGQRKCSKGLGVQGIFIADTRRCVVRKRCVLLVFVEIELLGKQEVDVWVFGQVALKWMHFDCHSFDLTSSGLIKNVFLSM